MPSIASRPDILIGAVVLILEDHPLISMELQALLAEWGAHAVAVKNIDDALRHVNEGTVHLACVNETVHGESSCAVARLLLEREIPFVFVSGYSKAMIEDTSGLKNIRHVSKPFSQDELKKALIDALCPG